MVRTSEQSNFHELILNSEQTAPFQLSLPYGTKLTNAMAQWHKANREEARVGRVKPQKWQFLADTRPCLKKTLVSVTRVLMKDS